MIFYQDGKEMSNDSAEEMISEDPMPLDDEERVEECCCMKFCA